MLAPRSCLKLHPEPNIKFSQYINKRTSLLFTPRFLKPINHFPSLSITFFSNSISSPSSSSSESLSSPRILSLFIPTYLGPTLFSSFVNTQTSIFFPSFLHSSTSLTSIISPRPHSHGCEEEKKYLPIAIGTCLSVHGQDVRQAAFQLELLDGRS